MTDCELLENAAKAAGIRVESPDGEYWRDGWNPLWDDGDALQLAVKMELGVMCCSGVAVIEMPDDFPDVCEPHGDDPCYATRRAIVRAAAEIGRAAA